MAIEADDGAQPDLPAAGSTLAATPPVNAGGGERRLNNEDLAFIERLLDRADKKNDRFLFDIWTYRAGAAIGIAIAAAAALWAVFTARSGLQALQVAGTLFVGNGIFAVAGDRSVRLLREQLDAIGEVIKSMFEMVKARG